MATVTLGPAALPLCSQALTIGLKAMQLSIWVLLFLTSLTPMFLYCWRRFQPKEVSPLTYVSVCLGQEAMQLGDRMESGWLGKRKGPVTVSPKNIMPVFLPQWCPSPESHCP